jgi:hypothetical protein
MTRPRIKLFEEVFKLTVMQPFFREAVKNSEFKERTSYIIHDIELYSLLVGDPCEAHSNLRI